MSSPFLWTLPSLEAILEHSLVAKLAMGGVQIPTWSRTLIVLKGVTKEAPAPHCQVIALKSVLNCTLTHPSLGFYFLGNVPQTKWLIFLQTVSTVLCMALTGSADYSVNTTLQQKEAKCQHANDILPAFGTALLLCFTIMLKGSVLSPNGRFFSHSPQPPSANINAMAQSRSNYCRQMHSSDWLLFAS